MKKVFEITLRTKIHKPTRNLFRLLWRSLQGSCAAISIPSPESCPRPLHTLLFAAQYSIVADIYTRVLLARLDLPGSTIATKPLPTKAGPGFVSSLLQISAKGAIVSARILTRLEGNAVRLSIYAANLQRLPHKVP